uniref:Capsid protein n=1 Tax=Marmot associated feces circular DNA molecule 3 TaxID=2800894 RepID=A0A7T7DFS2_9VIRU|nr:capsid protein [Marmot associated feces circular DNA molecule 3]
MPYTLARRTTTTRRYAKKPVAKKTYRKKVVRPIEKMANRSEQGMSNSFVPATAKPKFYGKLRYGAAALTFTATTGQVASYVFSANGLFDPNITGGALAPAGFNQLITLYEHYIVYRSKITVIFTNNSTTPTMVAIAAEPDVSASTDPSNMLELPFEQIVQLEGASGYGSTKTLEMSLDVSKYFGERVTSATSIYRGDAVSNPTEQVYFHCKAYGLKGGSAEVFMQVKIEFDAVFTEPRELSATLNAQISKMVIDEAKHISEAKAKDVQPSIVQASSGGLMSMFK